jgi:hypothetical protein
MNIGYLPHHKGFAAVEVIEGEAPSMTALENEYSFLRQNGYSHAAAAETLEKQYSILISNIKRSEV